MKGEMEAELSTPPRSEKKKSSISVTLEDFTKKHRLGKGAYGDVYLFVKNSDEKLYAVKQIEKKKLEKERKQYQALVEKELLTMFKHPGIIKLRYAFQDKRILYFVLEYCEGGEFIEFIRLNIKNITEPVKVFYIAEIVNLLEYLHKNGVTHRDLKPENLMLDSKGHLKLIDFGTAEISKSELLSKSFKEKIQKLKEKEEEEVQTEPMDNSYDQEIFSPKRQRKSTFVGTCYYISPELLEQNYCPPSADLWALGCIIYQLYYLETPFKDNYEFAVFEKIKKAEVNFPKNDEITQDAIDLIKKLLVRNPDQRLGSGTNENLTFEKLKSHPYFKGLNINNIYNMEVPEIENLQEPQKNEEELEEDEIKYEKSKSSLERLMALEIDGSKNLLMNGVIEKRTFVTYSCYYLMVYSDLKITRIKAEEPEKRKELFVRLDLPTNPAKLLSADKFELITNEKAYHFKSADAQKWVKVINDQFLKLKKT